MNTIIGNDLTSFFNLYDATYEKAKVVAHIRGFVEIRLRRSTKEIVSITYDAEALGIQAVRILFYVAFADTVERTHIDYELYLDW